GEVLDLGRATRVPNAAQRHRHQPTTGHTLTPSPPANGAGETRPTRIRKTPSFSRSIAGLLD
ncbi:MAG: hypothetical protein WKF43_16515, partial [Acidimicrobiales bacterium]